MAKRKPARKERPLLVISIPEALETEIEAATLRHACTKTAFVQRALQTWLRLERETLGGARIVFLQPSGEAQTVIFP